MMKKKMTKTEVKNKINKLIEHHNKEINKLIEHCDKELLDAVEGVLVDADMWYGDGLNYILNPRNHNDRNADQLIVDGKFGNKAKVSRWLYTRKEIEKSGQTIEYWKH